MINLPLICASLLFVVNAINIVDDGIQPYNISVRHSRAPLQPYETITQSENERQAIGLAEYFSSGIEPSAEGIFLTETLKDCKSYTKYIISKSQMIFRNGFDTQYVDSYTVLTAVDHQGIYIEDESTTINGQKIWYNTYVNDGGLNYTLRGDTCLFDVISCGLLNIPLRNTWWVIDSIFSLSSQIPTIAILQLYRTMMEWTVIESKLLELKEIGRNNADIIGDGIIVIFTVWYLLYYAWHKQENHLLIFILLLIQMLHNPVSSANSYQHLGCWNDTENRALNDLIDFSRGYTVVQCFAACSSYTYFSVQAGNQCFCENSWAEVTQYGQSSACSGQGTGGPWANDVYISGSKYFIGKNTTNSWNDARNYCKSKGQELASIHNEKESEQAKALCQTKAFNPVLTIGCWIGLNDIDSEGNFSWSDNTPYDYNSAWAPNQPNNYGGDEDCVHLAIHLSEGVPFSWNDASCTDWRLLYPLCSNNPTIAPTPSPTSYPTPDPSIGPTPSPTIDPTPAPTSYPSSYPTFAPSLSPTTCSEGNRFTNDGYEESINDKISSLRLNNNILDNDKLIISTELEYRSSKLSQFKNDYKQEMQCIAIGSCLETEILFENNTYCNLLCNQTLSCQDAKISINECEETQIICNGKSACHSMEIFINSDNKYKLDIQCGIESSCDNMMVNITGNIESNISCIDIRSCNGMIVNIEASNYRHNLLNMYSYSSNVTYSNGFGYEEEDGSERYINCNTENHFIKWNATRTANTKQTLTSLIENEYLDFIFPCNGVKVECFKENSSKITTSCDMKYVVDTSSFNITRPNPSSECYWVSVFDIIKISCDGDCSTSPTSPPTNAPTASPTIPTSNPTIDPTNDPTIDPTIDPTVDPTKDPSNAPTDSPSISPSQSPIADPTLSPLMPPTISPSQSPIAAPTLSPTLNPSFSPSISPSSAPTFPPTLAPTRDPTDNADKIYDTKIEIEYSIQNLSVSNKKFMVEYTNRAVNKLEEIIERNYFDKDVLLYNAFWLLIYEINGIFIGNTEISSNAVADNDDNSNKLTEYDLDINNIEGRPIIFTCKIESAQTIAGYIITQSGSPSFREETQNDLMLYFNNTSLKFTVYSETIVEESKFEPPKEAESISAAIILSIIFVILGVLLSIATGIYNRCSKTVDNAAVFVPFLIALNMYDFLSDINLSIQIFGNEKTETSFKNLLFILWISSIASIIIPFICNLYYAMRINSQRTIEECPSARAWFAKHLPQFILLCVFSAGTYPVLGLTSSRLFGLEFFNAGLLSSDLHELSKIKIKTTIFCENVPQLVIQIIYSYAIDQFERATILAFIASSLSIVASLIIYRAQKEQSNQFITTKYFLKLHKINGISNDEQNNIKSNKGLKTKLGESLSKAYEISNKSIEVGYITPNNYGFVMHIQHSIFKKELNSLKNKMFNNAQTEGFTFNINEDMYIRETFKSKETKILNALIKHFELSDGDNESNFKVSYYKEYEDGEDDNNSEKDADILNEMRKKMMMKRQVTKQGYASMNIGEDDEKYNNNNGIEIEMAQINNNNNNQHYHDIDPVIMKTFLILKQHISEHKQKNTHYQSEINEEDMDDEKMNTNLENIMSEIGPFKSSSL